MNNTTGNKGNTVALVTMMFLFAMIAFVTNLAAPVGVIWKNTFADSDNANTIGMLGNAMNFLAYFFMGIPSGAMLNRFGYKRTAMTGVATGLAGLALQLASGHCGTVMTGFAMYLLGAFVCGFAVCMLNTVVNPMTNLLGGGGNRGNQFNLIGGTLNSLAGTLTPMLVGSLIGGVTKNTKFADVNIVIFIAMGVFLLALCILYLLKIENPKTGSDEKGKLAHSPLDFRHFRLGAVAIFLYVGIEVGIPGTLFFYISDTTAAGGGTGLVKATAVAGFVTATYWFLMLVGRFCAGFIAGKVSSKAMLAATSITAVLLILAAMMLGKSCSVEMPVFTGTSVAFYRLPIAALMLVACGLCTSVMWSCIFNLSVEGLGKYTALGSGIFMMMVAGGGIMPLVQNLIADHCSYMASYAVPMISMAYISFYAVRGSRIQNSLPKDSNEND